jgi:hypothetical protein
VKYVGGTATVLGSWPETLAVGAVRTVKLELRNAAKNVYVNGTLRITSTDNAITAAGRSGVFFSGKAPTDTTGMHLDSIKVTNPA